MPLIVQNCARNALPVAKYEEFLIDGFAFVEVK